MLDYRGSSPLSKLDAGLGIMKRSKLGKQMFSVRISKECIDKKKTNIR